MVQNLSNSIQFLLPESCEVLGLPTRVYSGLAKKEFKAASVTCVETVASF